jgi:putative Mg2+ transporter-C (MgtC) family protein
MMDFFSNLWIHISSYLSYFSDFNWLTFLNNLFKIIAAFVIALPLALEREYYSRSLGLRTFPLVAVARWG